MYMYIRLIKKIRLHTFTCKKIIKSCLNEEKNLNNFSTQIKYTYFFSFIKTVYIHIGLLVENIRISLFIFKGAYN